MLKPFTMNNILITRRCNLHCDYCRIASEYYQGSPYGFPPEVSSKYWKMFGDWIKKYTDGFVIIYGGEPTIYPEFEDIIKHYNDIGLSYTVITNSVKSNYILKLVKEGILKGLSASIDPVMLVEEKSKVDKDRYLKSNRGFFTLKKAKEINPDIDVTAEITLDKTNYHLLPEVLSILRDSSIWASVTIYEKAFNKYYDFANSIEEYELTKDDIQKLTEIYKQCIQTYDNIHTPNALLEILESGGVYRCDLDKIYHTSTIEPNGDIRLCLRIKGIETPKHNIFDYINLGLTPWEVNDEIQKSINKDIVLTCEGCSWTCPKMPTSHNLADIKHV